MIFYTKYNQKTYKYAIQHFLVKVLQYHLETKLKMLYPAKIQSWATIGQPAKWRFAGGPIVARFYMLTESVLPMGSTMKDIDSKLKTGLPPTTGNFANIS